MTIANMFRNSKQAVTVDAGHQLFAEGERGDVMYAVLAGEIELRAGGVAIDRVAAGGLFGEMALIDKAPRSASAVATTATQVVAVDHAQFLYLVQEHPTFAIQVMRVMAERLRSHRSPAIPPSA